MNEVYILIGPYYGDSSGSPPQQNQKCKLKLKFFVYIIVFVFGFRIWVEGRGLAIHCLEDANEGAPGDVVEHQVHLLEDLGVDVFLLLMTRRTPSWPIILLHGESLMNRSGEGRQVACVRKESVLAIRELLYLPR
jgi:hypothetical protein